jgi:Na+/H+ antiporter NhaD/arsenite permease-like protein
MSEFAAANTASMVLFVGNPTNVVICEGFRVNNAAFTAYTILPFLGCSITCLFTLGLQFRSPKYIPKILNKTETLDVRSVLLDPIGACVGSLLLGTCLLVIIIVSFFRVDVWKISLPFAVAKFIYDIGWDHYRHVKHIPMLDPRPKRKSSDDTVVVISPDDVGRRLSMDDRASTLKTFVNGVPPSRAGTSDEPSSSFPARLTTPPIDDANSQTFVAEPVDSTRPSYSLRYEELTLHFPTFFTALPRLPFALVPFAFSQFILIEALAHQGWIDIFANWLVRASHRQMFPIIWLIGILGVILCNISGTNIGATILLTKVVRAAALPDHSARAAAIALAVASNIGAVSFTFSASLAGLLWNQILQQKGINMSQATFAYWNCLPLLVMTTVGLAIVSAEMAVLYPT